MIDLHYWPTPNGHKITIFLEETGLEYNIVPVNIRKGEQFAPEFLKISPNNRMPAIIDHQGPGGKPLALFESGAILLYLAEKTGQLLPSEMRARYNVVQWLMFQMAGVGPMMGQAGHFHARGPGEASIRDRSLHQRVAPPRQRHRQSSREAPYLAGDYSIADMATYPVVTGNHTRT